MNLKAFSDIERGFTKKEVELIFREFDKNKKGYLDDNESKALIDMYFKHKNLDMADKLKQNLFFRLDKDGDGNLSFDELLRQGPPNNIAMSNLRPSPTGETHSSTSSSSTRPQDHDRAPSEIHIDKPTGDNWFVKFANEKMRMQPSLNNYVEGIEHIGSTAVKGLSAKPIVDLAILVDDVKEKGPILIPILKELGYTYMGENNLPGREFFIKGENGTKRAFHLHVVDSSTNHWKLWTVFRDLLRADPQVLEEYEALKIDLAKKYQFDRVNYTKSKGTFINHHVERVHPGLVHWPEGTKPEPLETKPEPKETDSGQPDSGPEPERGSESDSDQDSDSDPNPVTSTLQVTIDGV